MSVSVTVTDRVAGVALGLVASAAIGIAVGFRAGFIADPIGPRAFPFGIAALVLALGLALALVGKERVSVDGVFARRALLVMTSLVVYVLTLGILGFVVVTTLEATLLSLVFGGRPLKSFIACLSMALVLFVLFVYGFSVPLPVGGLFAGN